MPDRGLRSTPPGEALNAAREAWWPEGLSEWIGMHAAAGDELLAELDRVLRLSGWPDYNVPQPLPRENTWPALALGLAQRLREAMR